MSSGTLSGASLGTGIQSATMTNQYNGHTSQGGGLSSQIDVHYEPPQTGGLSSSSSSQYSSSSYSSSYDNIPVLNDKPTLSNQGFLDPTGAVFDVEGI